MTQSKQQDKIQEIIGLFDCYERELTAEITQKAKGNALASRIFRDQRHARRIEIESKLRELVREPLDGDDLCDVIMSFDGYITGGVVEFVEHVERANGITSASGEV